MVVKWYLNVLDEYPVLTKSLTTGIIQFTADSIAQYYEYYEQNRHRDQHQRPDVSASADNGRIRRRQNNDDDDNNKNHPNQQQQHCRFYDYYSFRRGLSLFADGMILSGPLLHYCFDHMEQWISTESGIIATCMHVLINDYIIDSIYIVLSFIFTTIVEGNTVQDLYKILKHDLWDTLKTSWLSSLGFMPIEYGCFRYLNVSLRVLSMNFIDLMWGCIISFVSHRSRRSRQKKQLQNGQNNDHDRTHDLQQRQQRDDNHVTDRATNSLEVNGTKQKAA
jgi:Mpv17 / PMP22 family